MGEDKADSTQMHEAIADLVTKAPALWRSSAYGEQVRARRSTFQEAHAQADRQLWASTKDGTENLKSASTEKLHDCDRIAQYMFDGTCSANREQQVYAAAVSLLSSTTSCSAHRSGCGCLGTVA